MKGLSALLCLLMVGVESVAAQQIPDLTYSPLIDKPAYTAGEGPRVGIDEAHNNFHTVDGRYGAFAKLLRRDGYIVDGHDESFSEDSLSDLDILVIANPLNAKNNGNWSLPTPSAYSKKEIEALHRWVEQGGLAFSDCRSHAVSGGCV